MPNNVNNIICTEQCVAPRLSQLYQKTTLHNNVDILRIYSEYLKMYLAENIIMCFQHNNITSFTFWAIRIYGETDQNEFYRIYNNR